MSEVEVSSKNDSRPLFELHVSLPHDARFADTARELAIHAARQAGCGEAAADAFGRDVEDVVRGHIEDGGAGAPIPLIVRKASGPVEVLINGRRLTPRG